MPPKCGKCGQVCANPLAKRTHEAKCNSSANWTKVERGSDCAERRTVVITSDPPARTQYIPAPAPKVINRKPAVPTAVLAALKSRDEAAAKAKAIADKKAAADAKKAAKAKARADKKEAEQAMYLAEARAEAKAKEDGVKYVRPRRAAVADGSQHQEEELAILDEDEEPDDVQKAPHPDDFWDKERVAAQILLAEEREEEMAAAAENAQTSAEPGESRAEVEPAPEWAEQAMAEARMVPEETEEQKEKRWRAEQLAQLTAVESQTQVLEGESDMHMRELITNSERKINQLQLRDEHVKFDAPAEVQLLPAKQTSERVHGANSYYQCTKPVEMGAVSNELKEEMEKVLKHVTIKNYQWYDSTTFEVNAQHVRVFIELPGVGQIKKENIEVNHAEEWLELIVHGYEGADHRLLLRPLLKPIKGYKLRKKPDKLVLDLIKKPGDPDIEKMWGTRWEAITQ